VGGVQLGLIQFYGQYLDHVCARMARINSILYGLNDQAIRLCADVLGAE
jgi:hypothetical protein